MVVVIVVVVLVLVDACRLLRVPHLRMNHQLLNVALQACTSGSHGSSQSSSHSGYNLVTGFIVVMMHSSSSNANMSICATVSVYLSIYLCVGSGGL